MSIQDLIVTSGEDVFYTPGFMHTIELFLPWLKAHNQTRTFEINKVDGRIYKGDFYGLVIKLGYDLKYAWIIMRLSGLNNSQEFNYDVHKKIVLPPEAEILRIRSTYNVNPVMTL